MSPIIAVYFDRLERCLLESEAVSSYTVVRREITSTDGKIRIRARLKDRGLLELFEYVTLDVGERVDRVKYSHHWQDEDDFLVRRWDAVPHHQHLPHAPHHVHHPDGSVKGVAEPPDAIEVLKRIEAKFRQEREG